MATTTPSEVPAQTPNRSSPAARLLDLLAEEGYRPHPRDPDGSFHSIDFKAEGRRFNLRINEEDPDFVGICLGYRLDDEPTLPPEALLRAGHDAQADAKVVKFFLDPAGKFYELQAELFLGGQPLNAQHLERCLGALRWAAARFAEKLRADAPTARA